MAGAFSLFNWLQLHTCTAFYNSKALWLCMIVSYPILNLPELLYTWFQIYMTLFSVVFCLFWTQISNYLYFTFQADVKSSDILILTITKCLAVVYVYLQFKSLRRIGSKYLLGMYLKFPVSPSKIFFPSILYLNQDGLVSSMVLNSAGIFWLLSDITLELMFSAFLHSINLHLISLSNLVWILLSLRADT